MNAYEKSLIKNKIATARESLEKVQRRLKAAKEKLEESYVSNGSKYKNRLLDLEDVISDVDVEIRRLDVLKEAIK